MLHHFHKLKTSDNKHITFPRYLNDDLFEKKTKIGEHNDAAGYHLREMWKLKCNAPKGSSERLYLYSYTMIVQ